jgi:type II secretory pathway pseudopilin PulG
MTLLEVTVAMSIAGIAITIALAALNLVMDFRGRDAVRADAALRTAVLRRSLQQWIQNAALVVDDRTDHFRGIRQDGAYGHRDELTFLTTAATPLGVQLSEVKLSIRPLSDQQRTGLFVDFKAHGDSASETILLDSLATGLRLDYLLDETRGTGWLRGWISATSLPRAVRLQLEATASVPGTSLMTQPLLIPLLRAP